jgi:hypothetical protein
MSYGINLGQFNPAEHQAFTTIVGKDPLRSIGAFFNLMAMIADRPDFLTVSTNNAYSNVMSQKLSRRMERVSKYIQDHYQNTITLSEISDIASMTGTKLQPMVPSNLRPYFRRLPHATAHHRRLQPIDQHEQSHD